MGDRALLAAHDVHDGPLEPLGRVDRRERHRVDGGRVVVGQLRVRPAGERPPGDGRIGLHLRLGRFQEPIEVGLVPVVIGDCVPQGAQERAVVPTEPGDDTPHHGVPHHRALAADVDRHAEGRQPPFERQDLVVGPSQHRERGPGCVRAAAASDRVGHGCDLLDLVAVGVDPGGRTGSAGGDGVPVGEAGGPDHRGRRRGDLGGGAMGAVEVDRLQCRPAGAERLQETGIGAVPAVDRLVRVTDDEHVPAVAAPGLEELELQRVDVLELVDEEMPEPPALGGGEPGVPLQRAGAGREQIVEVDDVAPGLGLFVFGEPGGDPGRGPTGSPARGACRFLVAVGADHARPGPGDLVAQVGELGSGRVAGHLLPEEGLDPVEQLGRPATGCRPAITQLPPGDPVERARLDVVVETDGPEATAELVGGLAGEGHAQDVLGLDVARGDPVGDTGGQDPCLARAGRGDDGEGHGGGRRGQPLPVVEAGEHCRGVHQGRE